jgi:leucyl aminopeptidase
MPLFINESENTEFNCTLLPFTKDKLDYVLIKKYTGLAYDPDVSTKAKDVTLFFHPQKQDKTYILGLGDDTDLPKCCTFFRSFVYNWRMKEELKINVLTDHLSDHHFIDAVVGLKKGLYHNGTFKTIESNYIEPTIHVVANKKRHKLAHYAASIAEAQMNAMFLVDHPSNIKTPAYMANFAVESGKNHGYKVDVISGDALKEAGLDALIAVGQGSIHPPAFIIMEYKPKGSASKKPKLGLVGKGISFDTGGISIKPSTNMAYMKCDMAGAAAVIGAIELAARHQLDIHVVGVVPAAENSVDANSIRPGDVIGSYSKKSIEVLDTDAEGRLVLADGLAYIIKNYEPEYLIDLATLTGSCVAALGYHTAGLFTHNDQMSDDLCAIGQAINERVWRLPLWKDYAADMNSDIADIKNLSGKPVAGSITAAKFLEFFVSEHKNWAHLDIAGVAFTDSEFAKTRSASSYGVRLLAQYMETLIEKEKA